MRLNCTIFWLAQTMAIPILRSLYVGTVMVWRTQLKAVQTILASLFGEAD